MTKARKPDIPDINDALTRVNDAISDLGLSLQDSGLIHRGLVRLRYVHFRRAQDDLRCTVAKEMEKKAKSS